MPKLPGNTPQWAVRYSVAITPADVGARVSIRRRLTDGRTGLGDVVGELTAWSGGMLVVRRRTGEVVEIPEDTVVAGKRVPPQPRVNHP